MPNNAPNAYAMFMEEHVAEERRKGRNISMKIAAEECAPKWKNLTPEMRVPYQTAAKQARYKLNKSSDKMTSDGRSFKQIEAEARREIEEKQKMDLEINDTISKLLLGTSLNKQNFYVVHAHYYVHVHQKYYLPAEIALCKFNLNDGIVECYHSIVHPGEIPKGYGLEAKKNSEDSHDLPYPPNNLGERDWTKILDEMLVLLKEDTSKSGKLPPLYAIPSNCEVALSVVQQLADSKDLFRVYPLDKLFFTLKNRCINPKLASVQNERFPLLSNATIELSKDVFQYAKSISCNYHMTRERSYECSTSYVMRHIYIITDHCCHLLGIPLKPPNHCPENSAVCRSSRQSAASSYRGSEGGSDYYDLDEDTHSLASASYTQLTLKDDESLPPLRKPKVKPTASVASSHSHGTWLEDDGEEDEWVPVARGRGRKMMQPDTKGFGYKQ